VQSISSSKQADTSLD